jgi:hypothetical protein
VLSPASIVVRCCAPVIRALRTFRSSLRLALSPASIVVCGTCAPVIRALQTFRSSLRLTLSPASIVVCGTAPVIRALHAFGAIPGLACVLSACFATPSLPGPMRGLFGLAFALQLSAADFLAALGIPVKHPAFLRGGRLFQPPDLRGIAIRVR